MDKLTTGLTFDIIGAVSMDLNLNAQQLDPAKRSDFMKLYSEMLASFNNDPGRLPFWLTPRRWWHRRSLGKAIDRQLEDMIRAKSAMIVHEQKMNDTKQGQRSVFDLCIQGTSDANGALPQAIIDSTRDNIKTFLFAGHDTLSTLLLWIFYELSRTPHVLAALRSELDSIFGPDADPKIIRAQLVAPGGGNLVRRMTYASAVIKEALRLYPPASAMRGVPKGSNFRVHTPEGEDLCLDGLSVYVNHYVIQRDPSVYGETADDFVPERWLGDTDTSQAGDEDGNEDEKTGGQRKTIPPAAWRPFERGPRNCIGQELANIEARVILALVTRRYDFVKSGLGELDLDNQGLPVLNEKNQYKVKKDVYCVSFSWLFGSSYLRGHKLTIYYRPFRSHRGRRIVRCESSWLRHHRPLNRIPLAMAKDTEIALTNVNAVILVFCLTYSCRVDLVLIDQWFVAPPQAAKCRKELLILSFSST